MNLTPQTNPITSGNPQTGVSSNPSVANSSTQTQNVSNQAPLSVDDFANKIKQKFPQYIKMDNKTLTDKMIAKYPAYKNQVNLNPQNNSVDNTQNTPDKSALGEIFDFGKNVVGDIVKGVESPGKTAEAFSSALGNYLSNHSKYSEAGMSFHDVYQNFIEQANKENTLSGTISPENKAEARDITTAKGIEQTAGDIGSSLLNIATGGEGGALGKTALKEGGEVLVKDLAKTGFKKAIGTGVKYGAGYGASSEAQKGAGLGDLLLGTGEGAIMGGVLGGVGEFASKQISSRLNKEAQDLASNVEGKSVKKTAPISTAIMDRVARVNPTDAIEFKKMTGESIGEYLTKTGNFNAPDKIVTNEAEKFTKALNMKDEAIANLPGTYKNGAVDDALTGLIDKAKSTSGQNVKSPYLDKVLSLEKKAKTDGLSMKEISDVIRLHEREIKLGYSKMLNTEKVDLATNIDKELREFQDKTAKQLGLENLPELNKQIQTSKLLVDSLGKKLVTNELLNGISLTDWIMLSGGEPTSVAGLLTKKLFANKTVQVRIARAARALSNAKTVPELKAIIGETKFPRLEAGKTTIPTQDLPIYLTGKGKTQSQADENLQKLIKNK